MLYIIRSRRKSSRSSHKKLKLSKYLVKGDFCNARQTTFCSTVYKHFNQNTFDKPKEGIRFNLI